MPGRALPAPRLGNRDDCCNSGGRAAVAGSNNRLPTQTDTRDRALSSGWADRDFTAPDRTTTRRRSGPADHHRQPRRRRHTHRHRSRRTGTTRRLYAAVQQQFAHRECPAVQKATLRRDDRLHANHTSRYHLWQSARRPSFTTRAHGQRPHCTRQGASWPAQLRIRRHWQPAAYYRRFICRHERHPAQPRALQGRYARSHRCPRRTY